MDNSSQQPMDTETGQSNNELVSFVSPGIALYCQDAIEGMKALPDKSFDLAIVDPPYGASTEAQWKLPKDHNLKGFGGAWRLTDSEWDKKLAGLAGFQFTFLWLNELKRLVKPTGSIWIHATYHNAGFVNVACQVMELEIINEVIWYKRNSFPNLSGRRLTASHETIYWLHTGGKRREYRFNYEEIKASNFEEDLLKKPGKQLRTVWDIPNNKNKEELAFGSHPTQKPIRLTERLLRVSAAQGGTLLVPFAGSGTELVAGLRYGMACTGFEIDPSYYTLAVTRIKADLTKAKQIELF